jgi:hypothetical protein
LGGSGGAAAAAGERGGCCASGSVAAVTLPATAVEASDIEVNIKREQDKHRKQAIFVLWVT